MAHRIIGQNTADKQYNVNCSIKPDFITEKTSETFLQWRAGDNVFGVNFSDPTQLDRLAKAINTAKSRSRGATLRRGRGNMVRRGGCTRSARSPRATHAAESRPVSMELGHAEVSNAFSGYGAERRANSTYRPSTDQGAAVPKLPRRATATALRGVSPAIPVHRPGPRSKSPVPGALTPQAGRPIPGQPLSKSPNRTGAGPLSSSAGRIPPGGQHESKQLLRSSASAVFDSMDAGSNLILKPMEQLSPRDKRIKEIYTTELSYVQSLDYVIEQYLKPARDKGVLNPVDIKLLFCNVVEIKNYNKILLTELESRLQVWNTGAPSVIADIFIKRCDNDKNFLTLYSQYCNNHKAANERYEKIRKSKKISAFLKACQQNAANYNLGALLITPIQRVPRYPLLLREVLSKTETSHPDHASLTEAISKLIKLTADINQEVLKGDSVLAVSSLSKSITGIKKLQNSKRQLIKHGPMKVTTSEPYTYVLLFDDICAFAAPQPNSKKKLMIKETIQLETCWVDDLGGPGSETSFQIHSPDNSYFLTTPKKEFKTNWITKLNQLIFARSNAVGYAPADDGSRTFSHKFKDGSVYEGEWKEAKPWGVGKRTFKSNYVYEGSWANGKFEGQGTMQYGPGTSYTGNWQRGKPHGSGVLIDLTATYTGTWNSGLKDGEAEIRWKNGDYFKGNFANDLRTGYGTLICANGTAYEGNWENDNYHGKGKLTLPQGVYEGDFEYGERSGQGTLLYANGDSYVGSWKEGLRDGRGNFKSATGMVTYEGDWVADQQSGNGCLKIGQHYSYTGELQYGRKHGTGILKTPEGEYNGQWGNGKRHGSGTFTSASGYVYSGEWQNDLEFGKGTFKDIDGSEYNGKWIKGKRNGAGVFTYASGARFTGHWENNKRHGQGVMTYNNETVKFIGKWKHGLRDGEGDLTTSDGLVFSGMWSKDKRNGKGVLKYPDKKTVYEGNWANDRRDGEGQFKFADGTTVWCRYKMGVMVQPFMEEVPPALPLPPFLT
eukprot:TRINITY_DN3992_c0_g1_i1.p1 TRINITY_DN3992_c0_g1~~TRINITY_DN3992_c0_g1_i1.p1  ORF type:complete len:1039 (-),score=172.33 TRINITY_DN3992_c0_g1_i1:36-3047(-)